MQKNNLFLVICVVVLSGIILFMVVNNGSGSTKCVEEVTEINEIVNKNDRIYDVEDLNVKSSLPVFSDLSQNRNVVQSLNYANEYYFDLELSGKVSIKYQQAGNVVNSYLDVSNVIDIILFSVPAGESEQLLYLLTDGGDVYYYKFDKIVSADYTVSKVTDVSNVKRLFISHFNKPNAGGSWALFAITESNESIMINNESV